MRERARINEKEVEGRLGKLPRVSCVNLGVIFNTPSSENAAIT